MRYPVSLLNLLLLVWPGTALVGCGDGVAPSVGSIEVTTTTSSPVPGVTEYTFTIDAGPEQPIGLNATVTVTDLPAGTHGVLLVRYPAECTIEGGNGRTVSLNPGEIAPVTFAVSCPTQNMAP